MSAHSVLGFFNIGGYEWLIILIIALLLFGRRLPEVMRGLGGGVREFRKGIDGAADDRDRDDERRPEPKPRLEEERKPDTGATSAKPAEAAAETDERKQS